jgi:hypothetical protein
MTNRVISKRWKTSTKTRRLVPSEHEEQSVLIQWATLAQPNQPELGLLFAIPNGGHRLPSVAMAMKREGVKAGIPDLMLPVARCGYHGLFVEMKAESGSLAPEQRRWRDLLISQGYGHAVCYGFDAARQTLVDYLADNWRIS